MSILIRKIQKAWSRHGFLGTVRHAARKLVQVLREQLPASRRVRRLKAEANRAFDEKYHVDTGGFLNLSRLRIGAANWEYGFPYDPVEPERFERALQSVAFDPADFVFIDFGSGKGRALLLAAEYPFQRIIGVEFSPELHQIAENNLRSYHNPMQKCKALEVVCGDAVTYPLPAVPVVLFFFNPFDGAVMTPVIENVRKSYEAHPRRLVVLYTAPVYEELWDKADFLQKVCSEPSFLASYATRECLDGLR
jgi:SAM-dependent methyltransferase